MGTSSPSPDTRKMSVLLTSLFLILTISLTCSSPMCDGYDCVGDKCCHVNGQYWCSPWDQSCYGQTAVADIQDRFLPCSSNTTSEDLVKVSGQTERQDIEDTYNVSKSCSRYTGPCGSASQCRDACYRGGFHQYAWYPTYRLCCCDCSYIC